MTPIRETIARAIYASFAGGTSDETLDDMATAIAQSGADAVLRALDEAGLGVVPRDPSRAMLEAATNRPAAKGNSIDAIHTSVYAP